MLRRRTFTLLAVGASTGLGSAAARAQEIKDVLRKGRCAVLLRHAQTTAGIGDPAEFDLAVCASQRNLSEAGRAQAVATGVWFRAAGLRPRAVLTSAWCRCKDTAYLAFGSYEVWPLLNSTFGGTGVETGGAADAGATANAGAARAALLDRLASLGSGSFEVWVTHQVNITAMTGSVPAMGEGVVIDIDGRLLGAMVAQRFDLGRLLGVVG